MNIKWSINPPTEPGWYFAFYDHKPWRQEIEILKVTKLSYGDNLVTGEGTNGEMNVDTENSHYTHWSKIELPEFPK